MDSSFITPLYVVIVLSVYWLVQGWIARYLFMLILHLTRSMMLTTYIYAFLMLPGTFLHELSHWLAAKILFIRTYNFTVIPRLSYGGITLGSVNIETKYLGFMRYSIIGAAPFAVGTAAVLYISIYQFNIPSLPALTDGLDINYMATIWKQIIQTPYYPFWLYMIFVISVSMSLSPSDIQAWPLMLVILISMLITLNLLGGNLHFSPQALDPVSELGWHLGVALTIALVVDTPVFIVILFFHAIVSSAQEKRWQQYVR